jgi:hypothetical protein
MQATSCAVAAPLAGTAVPKVWNGARRSVFGDIALVAFLLAQCLDGVFTYVGVLTFGPGIEANPIIASLMAAFGSGPALAGAKVAAGLLGICLHVRQVHGAVALLSLFYVAAAIVPWSLILFF